MHFEADFKEIKSPRVVLSSGEFRTLRRLFEEQVTLQPTPYSKDPFFLSKTRDKILAVPASENPVILLVKESNLRALSKAILDSLGLEATELNYESYQLGIDLEVMAEHAKMSADSLVEPLDDSVLELNVPDSLSGLVN